MQEEKEPLKLTHQLDNLVSATVSSDIFAPKLRFLTFIYWVGVEV